MQIRNVTMRFPEERRREGGERGKTPRARKGAVTGHFHSSSIAASMLMSCLLKTDPCTASQPWKPREDMKNSIFLPIIRYSAPRQPGVYSGNYSEIEPATSIIRYVAEGK